MRMLPPLSHILTGMAAFALLTGVSAADTVPSAGVVMPRPPSFGHPARGPIPHRFAVPGVKTAFIADTDGGVYLFNKAGGNFSVLTFYAPVGLAVDTSDNLYVADLAYDTISILQPPYTGPRTVLNNSVPPYGVAVDRNSNVAAINQNGSVSLYARGATSPTGLVFNPSFKYGTSGVFDAQGNLYVSGLNSNREPVLGIILGGVKGTTISMLTTGNGLSLVQGIHVTTQGRIALLEEDTIYTYNPPNRRTGSLGEPIATTILANATSPDDFAFTASDAFVVVSDAGNCPPNGCTVYPSAELYAYPAGGNPIESVPFSEDQDNGNVPSAAAVSPPEIP